MFLLNIHYTAPYSPFFCHPHPHFYSIMFFSSHIFPSPLFLSLPVTMFSHALPHSLSLSTLLHFTALCSFTLILTLSLSLSPPIYHSHPHSLSMHYPLVSQLSTSLSSLVFPLVKPSPAFCHSLPANILSPFQYSLHYHSLTPLHHSLSPSLHTLFHSLVPLLSVSALPLTLLFICLRPTCLSPFFPSQVSC